jgi:hypothetical protein
VKVADIDVQKRRPSLWPFVVGAVALGLLVWGLIRIFDREEEWRIDEPRTTADTVIPAPVD